jgi:hypothetical protein
MSIVVTCGHDESDSLLAHSALKLAGIAEANSFRDGEFSPRTLTERIRHAYKLNGNGPPSYAQVSPAMVWQALSVDLLLANLDTEAWGWADPASIYFLDYWRGFDPGFKFVLVYSSPERILARLLERETYEPETIERALATWRSYNEELLRFHNANPECAVLVNAEIVGESPADFLSKVREQFELDLWRINEPIALDNKVSAAALWSASTMLSGFPEVAALFEELQSVADLPRIAPPSQERLAKDARSEFVALSKDLAAARSRDEVNVAAIQTLEEANESLRQAVAALEADRDQATRAEEQRARRDAAEIDRLKADLVETRAENSLLLRQIQEVQSELEALFLRHKALEAELDAARLRGAEAERAKSTNVLLQQQIGEAQGELERLRARHRALEAELDAARLRSAEADALGKEKSELQRAVTALRKEKEQADRSSVAAAGLAKEKEETKKENQLLLLQLQQVQEELENYFHKYNDLKRQVDEPAKVGQATAAGSASAASHQTSPVVPEGGVTLTGRQQTIVDMRHFVDGENWHNAEHDGRWAGPGKVSTLRLPRLDKGRYRLDLDVVDAMAPEIVRQLEVSFDGAPVTLTRRSMDGLRGPLAPLKRVYLTYYKRRQLYPMQFSGVVEVRENAARSQPQVEFSFPSTISPADRGEPDSRSLAIRLRQVVITPC